MRDTGGKGEDKEQTCDSAPFQTDTVERPVGYLGKKMPQEVGPRGGQVRGQGRSIHLKMEVQTTDMYDVEGASVRRERTAEKTQGKLQLGLSHQSGGRREPCGG